MQAGHRKHGSVLFSTEQIEKPLRSRPFHIISIESHKDDRYLEIAEHKFLIVTMRSLCSNQMDSHH